MDLRYATEHVILRESAEKFLAERYDYRMVQKIAASETGWNREIWGEFAKLGWLGLPFAPEDGGNGGGAVELSILMETFGKHLVIEPYLATVVLGGLIAALGSAAERQAMLPAVSEDNAISLSPLKSGTSQRGRNARAADTCCEEERKSFSAARARTCFWCRRNWETTGSEFSSCPGRRATSRCGRIAW